VEEEDDADDTKSEEEEEEEKEFGEGVSSQRLPTRKSRSSDGGEGFIISTHVHMHSLSTLDSLSLIDCGRSGFF